MKESEKIFLYDECTIYSNVFDLNQNDIFKIWKIVYTRWVQIQTRLCK
jgi:hypothetical protein